MDSLGSKIVEFSIEEIVKYINDNKIDESNYLSHIDNFNLKEKDKNTLVQKFKIVFQRKNLPLTTSEKLTFFFIPFGIMDDLIQKPLFHDSEKNFKEGYLKKQQQITLFSSLGTLFYFILFFTIHLINKAS